MVRILSYFARLACSNLRVHYTKLIGFVLILVFCLLEFGLYGVFIYKARQDWNARMKMLFITTLICLSLIPFYRYGGVNDFVMRTSIPALFVLSVFLGRTLHRQSLGGMIRIGLTALVVLGSVTALIEFRRHVTGIYNAGTILQTPAMSQVTSLSRWRLATEKDATIVLQYVGSLQSPFFVFLAQDDRAHQDK